MNRNLVLALGVAAALIETAVWHGPMGAADQFASKIERAARAELKRQEMSAVSARVEREPLSRRLILSGPADDFQQRELVRILDEIPGVSSVHWTTPPSLAVEQVQ